MTNKCPTCGSTATIDDGSACAQCGCDRDANERLALTPCSADLVDQLKRLADDWFARAVDEMDGAVKEKNARDGMNFYQHTARAAVLSDCRKQLMEIILPNSIYSYCLSPRYPAGMTGDSDLEFVDSTMIF